MADISIEEAKAKLWIDDVNAEIEAVEAILHKVDNSLSTVVGEDDSIMEGICKMGEIMESAWTEMCKNFKTAQSKLSEAVSMIIASAQTIIDDVDSPKSKISQ